MSRRRRAWVATVVMAAGCSGTPTSPRNVVLPLPGVSAATRPVIRSISVPTSRREAGTDIVVSAVVETSMPNVTFLWSANLGTIVGTGPAAVFRLAPGIQKGVDVVVSLAVVEAFTVKINGQPVAQEFRVFGQAEPFRVHDSVAEQKELARKFLIDLFGDSSVPPLACLVDFSDVGRCAKGKQAELEDITNHRRDYKVISRRIISQSVVSTGPDTGEVHSDAEFIDVRITPNEPQVAGDARGDFWLTTVYESNRWWLCESMFTPAGTGGLATIKRNRGLQRLLRAEPSEAGLGPLPTQKFR